MLEQVVKIVSRKMVEYELNKYGIELKHYVRGRVRISLRNWNGKEETLYCLLRDLQTDPDIITINYTKETKSAVIYYNHNAVKTEKTQRNWYRIFQKYS